MAKKELFHFKLIGFLVSSLGAFPVHRGQPDRKALRQAQQTLSQGSALVIFPEGMRSRSGRLQLAFPGAALIAWHSGAPILPVAITGTERISGIAWLLHRPRLTVNIGTPFPLPPIDGRLTKTKLAEFTSVIMAHVAELLPPENQGNYTERGEQVGTKG